MLNLEQIQMSESNHLAGAGGKTIQVNQAKESNKLAVARALWQNEETKAFRESFEKKVGFDFADSKAFPVGDPSFNWNAAARKFGHSSVKSALREADTSSLFPQVLRAGVQTLVNSAYQTVPTTFESWTHTVNSNKNTELYAPLQGISFLRMVGAQELYPESRAAGLDIKLTNYKFGENYSVESELLQDDTTGQFASQTKLLGEYAKLCVEAYCYGKLAGKFTGGVKAQYADLIIPNTETQPDTESVYPFAPPATPFVGGGSNRPATFTVLDQAGIKAGFIALMNQKNLLGLKMSVDPDTIICSPQDRFNLAILLNSSFYPSVASGTAGATGTGFAINPIESIAKAVISRFMFKNDGTCDGTSRAWYLMDTKKPAFVLQLRESAVIQQEAPNAGESFNRDVVRFKMTQRMNADWIDPRFCYQGNDGSVSS